MPERPHSEQPPVQAQATVTETVPLWFGPDDPVRAASAVTRLGDGWLIAQDDATHGAWWRPATGTLDRLRLLPARDGLEVFSEAAGTKHRKPDLEAACAIPTDGGTAALLLGSGSLPARTHAVVVEQSPDGISVHAADLAPLYARVRAALELDDGQLNLEGACVVDGHLRWFQRGHHRTGVPSASVDLELAAVVAAVAGRSDPATIAPRSVRRYDLGALDGIRLSITDAVTLPDGRVCVSATAEDAPDPVADGPVAGSALALLGEEGVAHLVRLPEPTGGCKLEGLALRGTDAGGVHLLAVVDQDDPQIASLAIELTLPPDAVAPRSS